MQFQGDTKGPFQGLVDKRTAEGVTIADARMGQVELFFDTDFPIQISLVD